MSLTHPLEVLPPLPSHLLQSFPTRSSIDSSAPTQPQSQYFLTPQLPSTMPLQPPSAALADNDDAISNDDADTDEDYVDNESQPSAKESHDTKLKRHGAWKKDEFDTFFNSVYRWKPYDYKGSNMNKKWQAVASDMQTAYPAFDWKPRTLQSNCNTLIEQFKKLENDNNRASGKWISTTDAHSHTHTHAHTHSNIHCICIVFALLTFLRCGI